jgi:hypothetical protein
MARREASCVPKKPSTLLETPEERGKKEGQSEAKERK